MGFRFENVTKGYSKPDGHYLMKNGVAWLIDSISISASGIVSLKLYDPIRKEQQMVKAGTIGELATKVEGFVYWEDV